LAGGSGITVDYITGIAFAIALYVLIHNQSPAIDDRFGKISRRLAGFSYTLYVTHLPLLVFVRAVMTSPTPWYVAPSTVMLSVVLTFVCLVYADLVSRVTEHKTAAVREFFMRRLLPRAASTRSH
jgi:peptidoglycan/LPS O-acetylase OafA/YrhL